MRCAFLFGAIISALVLLVFLNVNCGKVAFVVQGGEDSASRTRKGSTPPLSQTSLSIENDIFPPLPSWTQLQKQLRRAKCFSTMGENYLRQQHNGNPHTVESTSPFSYTLSSICRKPIAVIITDANPGRCPSCQLFAKDILSPSHLAELNVIRDTYANVVLHVVGERPPRYYDSSKKSRKNGKKFGIGRDSTTIFVEDGPENLATKLFFSDLLKAFPIPFPLEESWPLAISLKSSSSPRAHSSHTSLRYAKKVAPVVDAAEKYWKDVRDHPLFRKAWEKSYASEGEYALRILFLWPHNGSVMPITNPEWSSYIPVILREELEEAGEKLSSFAGNSSSKQLPEKGKGSDSSVGSPNSSRKEKHLPDNDYADQGVNPSSPEFPAHGIGAHLYISAADFLNNAMLASEMVNSVLSI